MQEMSGSVTGLVSLEPPKEQFRVGERVVDTWGQGWRRPWLRSSSRADTFQRTAQEWPSSALFQERFWRETFHSQWLRSHAVNQTTAFPSNRFPTTAAHHQRTQRSEHLQGPLLLERPRIAVSSAVFRYSADRARP